MPFATGTKFGPFTVTAPLGAGGMGEVYRARDTRLARDVAIKVLPTSIAIDAERLRRFEQEARATGSLNHPNILQIYDIGAQDGTPYVVSELLEGETLRDRIGGTALPARKAIDYATQIAKGLAAAHDKAIVHRDLKPENIFVTRDGRVKILDFGLAKLTEGGAHSDGQTHTAMAGTDAGTVLGTVGYMSPEQVRAQPVDHRSDIFSFGSVLYEMLSGRRAFRGDSAVETMNAILKEDPADLSATNRNLPPALERIVSHCLEKHPEERFQSARDIAFGLEQLSGSSTPTGVTSIPRRRRHWRPALAAGLGLLVIGVGAYSVGRRSVSRSLPEFHPITFQSGLVGRSRYAADGRTIIFSAVWPGTGRDIFSAQAGNPESRSLGLKGAILVGVSRNDELGVLLSRGPGPGKTLARLPMGGGAPREVLQRVLAADWGPDGTSFAVVRAAGGRSRLEYPIGKTLYEAVYIENVRVSPRGDLVAFTNHPVAGDNRGDVEVVDLSGKKRTLSSGWSDIRGLSWAPDGSEVWFTATREGIELNLWGVSTDGRERLVYRAPGNMTIQDSRPDGRVLLVVGRAKPSILGQAPGESAERNLSWMDWGWAVDLSPDGRALLFGEQGDGGGPEYAVYLRGTDGSPPVMLGKGGALSLSSDGRWALALNLRAPAHLDLLPTGAGQPRSLARGPLVQFHWGAFFPDDKRIAICGNEEGKGPRIWVQAREGGDPASISPEGIVFSAGNPVSPDGLLVAGEADDGPVLCSVEGGEPRPLRGGVPGDTPLRWSRDGRFLYVREDTGAVSLPARICRIEVGTGAREVWREVSPTGMNEVGTINAIAIAPDAGAHAYTYFEPMTTLYEVSGFAR
jgi:serine/threonine protein kinase/Tol biopolymer transport system component